MEQTFGRYRLLERIAEGGMAEVWKAKSYGVLGFEKVLVIKRILPELAKHRKFVDMFVHEAKLAVLLSHANIVQVFDLGKVDGDARSSAPPSYFIAMEYVAGLDLATVLQRSRRMKIAAPPGLAVFIAAEVAKALDYAHRKRAEDGQPLGIVHRDISPQNILLSWEGEVKVTDFGIAKARDTISDETDSDVRLGRVRGKLAYMSPEQLRAEPLDGRSDLFSLGVVLYEMIAGSNPFTGASALETVRRIQTSEFPPLDLTRPETPWPLVAIVHRMLAAKPEGRFGDAGHLHEELLGYAYGAGDRFGPNDLARFLASFQEAKGQAEIEPAAVFQERAGADERTPVEVPQPLSMRITGPVPSVRSLPAEMGERREVTALVIAFSSGARSDEAPTSKRSHAGRADGARIPQPDRAREVVARYGAKVIEREVTHMVAIFGLGEADGQDTEAAVRAGLAVVRSRRSGSASAGVHVGRILVDPSGLPVRDERLASLIAGAQALARATDDQVAVSPLSARILRSAFTTEALEHGSRAAPEGGRVVTSIRPPSDTGGRFVGRADELKRLGGILAAATARRAQLVILQGDNGIGKTRLIAEMERRLSRGNYNVGFYAAPCPKNGAGTPFSGMTSMLQVLCGIAEGDDEERVLGVLPRLRALGLQDDTAYAVLAQLGAPVRGALSKTSHGLGSLLRAAFGKMVQSLCDDRLHCFAWDDAHTMDSATAEAILATANKPGPAGTGLRAVFLFSTRDRIPPVLAEAEALHRIALGQLSEEDSGKLLAARINARILPPELIDFCRERAGGHPLFLEELIKELVDSGAVSVLNGIVKTRLEGATAVPRTLRALIATRVSRLDPKDRILVQAAAILGEPILTDVLAALLLQKVAPTDRAVAHLASRDIFRILGPSQVSFASPMHAEIVLDAIPPEIRQELHAAAAEAYITVLGDDALEHAERIAQHLYQAGDRDRAATFFARAALLKIRVRQLEPALRLITSALDLADHDKRAPAELLAWLEALADVASRVRAGSDLPAVAARALRRVDSAGSLEHKVLTRLHVARALGAVSYFQGAYALLDEAFALTGDTDELCRKALAVEVEMAVRSGDFARAARAADKIESMGPIRHPRLLIAIAQARAASGNSTAALRALDRAELLGGSDDAVAASEREKQRALVYIFSRDFKAAVAVSARAVDLARSAGLRAETAAALHNLGDASRRLGELPRAYASMTESLEIAESAGFERLVSINRIHLTFLDGLAEAPKALTTLKELIRYADSRGYVTDVLEGRCLLGVLELHRGNLTEAKRELEGVLSMAIAYGNKLVADDAREALRGL
ncbi:MAG: protein kinase [Polyangiaceae bacterium]|nr:protein kinase [Polyangiaceae bacterium]